LCEDDGVPGYQHRRIHQIRQYSLGRDVLQEKRC
jgi:hypothetical protein